MVESIYYYPKQRKRKITLKIWILLFIGIAVTFFWYFDKISNTIDTQPILIKVSNSRPKPVAIKVTTQPKISKDNPQAIENLDEVIPIHNQKK